MALESTVRVAGVAARERTRDIRKTALDPDFWYPLARSRDVGVDFTCVLAGGHSARLDPQGSVASKVARSSDTRPSTGPRRT